MTSPTPSNKLRSQSLDLLRLPLAVVVAIIHIVGSTSYVTASGHHVDIMKMPGAEGFYAFINAFLKDQSVPIYFFIAGYVFFLGITLTMETYGRKLQNRCKSLLYPYLIWNTLALVVMAITFLPSLRDLFPSTNLYEIKATVPNVLESYWNAWYGLFSRKQLPAPGAMTYPADGPLWFVRDLMIIVLTAPFIYWMLRHTRWYVVSSAGLLWFFCSAFHLGHFNQLATGYFFFSWGAYMSYHHHDMIEEFRKWFRTALLCYLVVGIIHMFVHNPEMSRLLKNVNVFCGMYAAYGLASWLLEKGWVKPNAFLASSSFFVYAGHGIFVAYNNALLFRWLEPQNMWAVAGIFLLNLVVTVSVLIAVYRVLGLWFPKVQMLLGGRNYPKRPR